MDNTKLKSSLATKAQALQETPAEREPASLVPKEVTIVFVLRL